MKRILVLFIAILLGVVGFSQTMTIHYKNGQSVKFSVESIDFIDFQERSEGDTTVSKGEAVDLGLSVLWASHNIGASSPEQNGDMFAWGEVTTKSDYTKGNYTYYNSNSKSYVDIGIDIGGTEFDAAHVKWGGNWRMPTLSEFKELKNNCEWKWVSYNGVHGYKVTGKNGNSIFIAPTGDWGHELWASHISSPNIRNEKGRSYMAACYRIGYDSIGNTIGVERQNGNYIRPVMSK